jgi:Holliday junction resolvasome RuvABC endonuclease subunit
MTRVVGLDLSITATGFADIGGVVSTIKTKLSGDKRLNEIRDRLADHFVAADLAVVEDLPFHAKAAGITGMVHGVVRAALIDANVHYVTVVPSTLKKYATGKGNADKTAMAIAALKRFGAEFADDNQCDAFWLRVMGLDAVGEALTAMPAVNRESLAKVKWPTRGVIRNEVA